MGPRRPGLRPGVRASQLDGRPRGVSSALETTGWQRAARQTRSPGMAGSPPAFGIPEFHGPSAWAFHPASRRVKGRWCRTPGMPGTLLGAPPAHSDAAPLTMGVGVLGFATRRQRRAARPVSSRQPARASPACRTSPRGAAAGRVAPRPGIPVTRQRPRRLAGGVVGCSNPPDDHARHRPPRRRRAPQEPGRPAQRPLVRP